MLKKVILLAVALLAGPALAQDGAESLRLGNDVYQADEAVRMAASDVDDAFLAGARLNLDAPVSGSAHMAGRWLDVNAEVQGALYLFGQHLEVAARVGGDVYGAGQNIRLAAPVGGDATLAGQRVAITADIAGDLRAFGSDVSIKAPVGGGLIASGERIELDAAVVGDAALMAADLILGPDARIGGTLTLYEDEIGTTDMPETVVPADRLQRVALGRNGFPGDVPRPKIDRDGGFGAWLVGVAVQVLVVGVVTAVLALLAPVAMQEMRAGLAARPWRVWLTGFAALSVLLGGGFAIAVTLVGVLLTPVFWIVGVVFGVAGYLVIVHALGSWGLSLLPGWNETWVLRVAAAFLGALLAALIGGIPVLGWIVLVLLVFAGAGVLALRVPMVARLAG